MADDLIGKLGDLFKKKPWYQLPYLLAAGRLVEIRDELRGLRADLGRRKAPADGDEALIELLRCIRARACDAVFAAGELVADAAQPPNEGLYAAIVRANGDANPKRLGKLLRKIEGVDYGGFQIRRLGIDRLGVIWQCCAVIEEASPRHTRRSLRRVLGGRENAERNS